jgi:hypothetical protein
LRPPPEFLGQARLLRQRVAATDDLVEPTMKRALRPIRERLARHPRKPLRESTLIDARRVWLQQMPGYGRLGAFCDIKDRYAPAFYELRLGAVRFSCDGWDEAADGLVVSLVAAKVKRGKLTVDPALLATISLHCLGRRIQRGWDRSDDAVFSDLGDLAYRYVDLVDGGGDRFSLAVSDGQWAGSLLVLDDRVTLFAQTFLDADGVTLPARRPDHDICALLASLPRGSLASACREPRSGSSRDMLDRGTMTPNFKLWLQTVGVQG